MGVFHALHAAYPQAEIAWAIQPEFAGLLKGLPGLTRVIHFQRHGGWRAWAPLRRSLREFAPDLAVDCQGNMKSAAVMWASGARRRVGLAKVDWREPAGCRVLSERAKPLDGKEKHGVDRMVALVRHLVPTSDAPLRMDVALSEEELSQGRAVLEEFLPSSSDDHGAPTSPSVIVHLSSGVDIRGWQLDRWKALVQRLLDDGQRVLLLSGPGEESVGQTLEERLPVSDQLRHWVGQRGLRPLVAVFSAAAERGMAMLGCDSGPAHLAAASGLPVVLLAGPQDPDRTGPWPIGADSPHRVVQARDQPSCQPCLERSCNHSRGPICMSGIEVADVCSALAEACTGSSVQLDSDSSAAEQDSKRDSKRAKWASDETGRDPSQGRVQP
ncbi:MAG: heptosyltransferase-1 [Planctomycetota bacterium]|jgi:heptosyltransferase-1